MKYLEEIRAFHEWLIVNEATPNMIALWHALNWFMYSTGKPSLTLESNALRYAAKLSPAKFYTARNGLIEGGLIEYRPKKKGVGKYRVLSVPVHRWWLDDYTHFEVLK